MAEISLSPGRRKPDRRGCRVDWIGLGPRTKCDSGPHTRHTQRHTHVVSANILFASCGHVRYDTAAARPYLLRLANAPARLLWPPYGTQWQKFVIRRGRLDVRNCNIAWGRTPDNYKTVAVDRLSIISFRLVSPSSCV